MGWWGRSTRPLDDNVWWRGDDDQMACIEIGYDQHGMEHTLRAIVAVWRLKEIADLIWDNATEPILEMNLGYEFEERGLLEVDPRKCVGLWAAPLVGEPGRWHQIDHKCWISRGFRGPDGYDRPFWRS